MSSEVAIRVRNVSKHFQIYSKPHHRLMQGIFRGRKTYFDEFSAIRNISFDIHRGEVVGITGRNGSGKSTLLQILCGTMAASTGSIEVSGRIAALLELGSGFSPEFTGRENVYLNGSILGLSPGEVDARFESIANFAEIGDFIEQPVKTYSSGMLLRLAFAIAINVDPEILVIDEALSVGDERFQRKCFSRIEDIRKQGATILFVSHAANTVVSLCDRALLIDRGELLAIGEPKTIVGHYQKLLYAPDEKTDEIRDQIRFASAEGSETRKTSGSGEAESESVEDEGDLEEVEVFDPDLKPTSTLDYEQLGAKIESATIFTLSGRKVNNLIRGKRYRYVYTILFSEDCFGVRPGMQIKTTEGVALGGAGSVLSTEHLVEKAASGTRVKVDFQFNCNLNPGIYFLNAGVLGDRNGDEVYLHRSVDTAMFRVVAEANLLGTGLVDFGCTATIE